MKKLTSSTFLWSVGAVVMGIAMFNFIRGQLVNADIAAADQFLY